ncbi:PREDICTED: pre-B-cell leukemia transcription factor-interacting protein 1 isoform X2 [Cyprinodon variegatus]|uniref:pre-B-cell leukemia transcription factor-interacting protein 1 isoform X2 n=1 Tax=Cyprinodon variegatus TaxID=28743 RepID=UPI00074275E4|nr:PREDICTED: pre-B-cell leukemia transcription factor-interacting protein 1 isoform X2 [Cyprinodon variegatus]
MSGGGAANNSWTILTSEETAAETLRPLAEGMKTHDESLTSATGAGEKNQPPKSSDSAERLPKASEEKTADQSAESHSDQNSAAPPPADVSGTLDHDVESRAEDFSSSDSYTILTPSPDRPQASLLSTETLGGAEFSQAEEELPKEEAPHLQNEDQPQQEREESGGHAHTADMGKDGGVERTEKTGEKEEPETRRKKSLLEQIGRKDEEEEELEEEFQVPQQENEGVFSLNKCILAALILLGLGTIFFSGVLMDLDGEGDYATRELKDAEAAGKQEWLNSGVPPGLDPSSSELLNKLDEESRQVSALQAQLQAQKEELKVAKEQAVEGAKERLLWEEMEKENSRLKTEIASLPVLQKENDRMKKELESVPSLQKELETLRSTVTNLKLSPATSQADQESKKPSTSPPSGQTEDGRQDGAGLTHKKPRKTWDEQRQKDLKGDAYERDAKKQWKEREKSVRKEGGKESKKGDKMEWKEVKPEHGKFEMDKDKLYKQKRRNDETKRGKEKELKKKGGRGDEGRPWEDTGSRKEGKEGSNLKKGISEKVHEGKEWTGKKRKEEGREGKHHKKPKEKEAWKEDMDWKKGKHGTKEKQERQDWREKGDKKDPKWKDTVDKDRIKEGKGKGERKQWDNDKYQGKDMKGKDGRKKWNENEKKGKNGKQEKKLKIEETFEQFKNKEPKLKEKKHNVEWEKDQLHLLKRKKEAQSPAHHGHKEEHRYGEGNPKHSHPKPSMGQPEYWRQQRERLQHDSRPPQQCTTLETCAQAEGLLPVPLSEFQSVLQTYLTKAEEAGVDASKTSELRNLISEFFKDGMFVHDQRSFQDFVDDLADILEDMVEVEDGGEEDSDLEDEMEEFEKEVLRKFSLPVGSEEERMKGEQGKEVREERG